MTDEAGQGSGFRPARRRAQTSSGCASRPLPFGVAQGRSSPLRSLREMLFWPDFLRRKIRPTSAFSVGPVRDNSSSIGQ